MHSFDGSNPSRFVIVEESTNSLQFSSDNYQFGYTVGWDHRKQEYVIMCLPFDKSYKIYTNFVDDNQIGHRMPYGDFRYGLDPCAGLLQDMIMENEFRKNQWTQYIIADNSSFTIKKR